MHEIPITPQVFDPSEGWSIVYRKLPHWTQAGTLCFITFRTFDSIPDRILKGWHAERAEWLAEHDIRGPYWRQELQRLDVAVQRQFHERFSVRWHNHLDAGHGACVLKKKELAQIVANSLLHFDNDRYLMTDFIIMPNHVHVLAAFRNEEAMLDQCDSWKHFTATQLNRELGTTGRFWQQDGFDHLLRSAEQFFRVRRYIADNPKKARLQDGQFIHYSRPLPEEPT